MPFKFEKIPGFRAGLINAVDPRDIKLRDPRGLSKAQNISLDVGGKVRTIGGLTDFTKVDGTTALTQTAKLCPGASLFTYGSDHWRGTETVVDLLSQANAASDHDADNDGPNATTGWAAIAGSGTLASVADTDGTTIASNGTTYILKLTNSTDAAYVIGQSATTVIGQRYILSSDLYNLDATDVELFVGTTSGGGEYGTKLHSAASWSNHILKFVATTTTVHVSFWSHSLTGEIVYIDDVYLSKIPRSDLDTNWLSLVDAANAQVDLYNINDDAFAAGLLDFGTVSSYVATIDTINFPTTKTITDSTSQFLNQGIKAGDIKIISGSALNNIMFVVEHVTAGTIRARGNPFVVDVDDDGTITLTEYNPVAFHYVNEALRASPANGGIALRPKHYSFADRTHFEGTGSSERKFSDWFLNDVGPVAPTDVSAEADAGDQDASALSAGAGWEVGITTTADDGEWTKGTYVIACFFTYDDGQMSALYVPSTDEEFGTTIVDGDSLTITVRGKNDYDERISGGGVCCRLDESDEPWSLLADISMAKGARATLSGTYNAWAESATADVAYTAAFKSLNLNVDSYESLAGIDPTTTVETFSGDNAFWNASVIGGNRCFIFAPRYTDAGGNLQQFRDRIMYSQVNAYDTFPIDNIIDVVKGDAEDYVVGGIYGNDLLAFKSRTLYIIDISDPDPAGWQMKQDKNKGKYPRRGVAHPGAYFETPHGPAWCNEFGVFLYTGGEIVELLKDKIELSEHPLAYQRYMEFDGSNDYVTKSNDADLNFGPNTDFSLEVIFRADALTANARILEKGGNNRYGFLFNSTSNLRGDIDDNTTEKAIDSDTTILVGTWYHGTATFDRNGNANLYLNGVSDATAVDISAVGDIDDATKSLAIGILSNDLSSNPFDGDIALARVWNRVLTSAEALALSNGQPVLAADQWGAIYFTADWSADADSWTDSEMTLTGNIDSVSDGVTSHNNCLRAVTDAGNVNHQFRRLDQVTNTDKDTRIEILYYIPSGQSNVDGFQVRSDASNVVYDARSSGATPATVGTWTALVIDYTPTDATANDLRIVPYDGANQTFDDAGGDDIIYLAKAVQSQIGCVAEYAPKGIGDATWTDESTNDLDGTVVGATAIFEDSWAKFFTDYSILGYHARTNQLIIMRDCTGKWSSGQDYGDCWIIDLDTLASTTGRRIFTKGIAYSNWATDWDQELIIAEQTSSTSVTIKQWTDEPQSQAVGLIDIRTADFDFGNPMFAKIFDALVAFYKSSAAQTTPVSYALDGDDRQTAWIRITGNFTPEGFWEKLTLEPTPIECDTIRFKLDNPTNASTMELNDLTLRYDTEEEDID